MMKKSSRSALRGLSCTASMLSLVLGLAMPAPAREGEGDSQSAGYGRVSDFSRNPADVTSELLRDDEPKESQFQFPRFDAFFQPWYDFKEKLNRDLGLQFGVAWTPLYQTASSSPGEKSAAGGIAELFGTWTLFGRGSQHPGILGFRVEDRHRLRTDIPPQSLGSEIGSAWSTATGFGEIKFSLLELWWEQHFIKDRVAIRAGKMLPFAVYDYFRFKSPKTGFLNQAFNVNPTIAFSSFGLGASLAVRPTEDFYIIGGLHDGNAKPTRAGFDTFFDEREYFKALDIGWDPGFISGRREGFFDGSDYHVTLWHSDKRTKLGIPEGHGFTVAAEQPLGDKVFFLRYGYSHGNATALRHLVAGGVAFTKAFGWEDDVIGLGASWGRTHSGRVPVDIDSSGNFIFKRSAGVDQYALEAYYSMQLTPRFTVTPDVQLIIDPAFNPDKDWIGLFGIRARFAF